MNRRPFGTTIALSAAFLALAALSCDTLFPSQSKPEVPSDHTRSLSGALHRPGWNDPMEACAECHGDSLQGGVQWSGNRRVVAPSCYQCHGAVWESVGEDGDDGRENDD
jgi:hypothetical protein